MPRRLAIFGGVSSLLPDLGGRRGAIGSFQDSCQCHIST